jgi:hypothetical protein
MKMEVVEKVGGEFEVEVSKNGKCMRGLFGQNYSV